MIVYILISIAVGVLAVVIAAAIILAARRSLPQRDSAAQGKYPQGYWMGIGIAIGIAIGSALGFALESMGAGIALGIAIGAGIGASLEERYRGRAHPLDEQEKKNQKVSIAMGIVITGFALTGFLILMIHMLSK
jgi:hypothetical protein